VSSPAIASPVADGGVVRDSARIALGTGLSRVTGLIRVGIFAWALGQSGIADAFNLANVLPNLLYELVLGGVLSATLVPLFVDADRSGQDDGRGRQTDDVRSVIWSVGFTAALALTVVGLAGVALVSSLFGGGRVGAEQVRWDALIMLAALLVPQIFFYGLTTLAGAALNARRIFGPPAYTPVLTNIVTSVGLIAVGLRFDTTDPRLEFATADRTAVLWLGITTTAGIAAMAFPLLVVVRRDLPALRWRPQFRHPVIQRLLRMSTWTVGYVVANQLALLVITALLNGRRDGSLTAYQQAFIFFQLPHGLFAVSLMTTVLPSLSSAHLADDLDEFRNQFLSGLRLVLVVILPAAAGYVALAAPLVATLLERGAFTSSNTEVTSRTLIAFALGLPGFSVYLYALRAFYARSDTKRPFVLNVIENLINVTVAVGIAAAFGAGAPGMAAAFSVAYTISAGLALRRLAAEIGGFGPPARSTALDVGRMSVAALAMGVLVAGVARSAGADLSGGVITQLAIGVVVGVLTYGALATTLQVRVLAELMASVRTRLTRA